MSNSTEPATEPLAAGALAPPGGRRLRPGDERLLAWRAFLRTHAHIVRLLEQDLQVNHKIALASYDVLVQLAEASDNRLRMAELADAVLISRSGLTRLVDRLQREGLVERQPDPEDARGLYTVLTSKGRQALRDASIVHLAGVSRLYIDRLSPGELTELARLMIKLDPHRGEDELPDAACGLESD
ncbi:MAG: transcriptional regulator, MarR family [Frankiales bacterium]|jgi:DNA-binding MarR family transcriptional regulator|nr:transcriptional regulator, MarR family [Frankiales bacterium]